MLGNAAHLASASEVSLGCRVKTIRGRTISGEIAARTDQHALRLSSSSERASIEQAIRWSTIVSGWIDGRWLSATAFKAEALQRIRNDRPKPAVAPAAHHVAVENIDASTMRDSTVRESIEVSWQAGGAGTPRDAHAATSGRVRSLAIDATVANWDGDVEPDGILLWVQPLDEFGQLVATRGTLTCELAGNWPATIYQPQPLARLAHWSRSINPKKLAPRGYLAKLEFQALHPDLHTNVGPYGLLHCALSVPGAGTFEETVAVRIRPYNPLRDQWQRATGSRFLPTEMLGRTF